MSNRSNLFANLEDRFIDASEDELLTTAKGTIADFVTALNEKDMETQTIFGAMLLLTKLGVADSNYTKKKKLIDAVFTDYWNGQMDDIYSMVSGPIDEENYHLIELLTKLGNEVAIPALYYYLSVAYFRGVPDDTVAGRLDGIFGLNLMKMFLDSGLNEVPGPKLRLTRLEADVVAWFKSTDGMHQTGEIKRRFSTESETDLRNALHGLVEKGILNYSGNGGIITDTYVLLEDVSDSVIEAARSKSTSINTASGGTKKAVPNASANKTTQKKNGGKNEAQSKTAKSQAPGKPGAGKMTDKEYIFPVATSGNQKHSMHDFLGDTRKKAAAFGGLLQVNSTGADLSFESAVNMLDLIVYEDNETVRSILEKAISAAGAFDLAATARKMAELFRVNIAVFDEMHDREQEIASGLIQRIDAFTALRSFAWTLSAYCKEHSITPGKVELPFLKQLVEFIALYDGINFQADDNCPALCSGDDFHVFYLPDKISYAERKALLQEMNAVGEGQEIQDSTMSLDMLRKELKFLYPAIKTIYSALETDRDRNEALTGNQADILYAWCAVTYAAREPFYSADGPMTWDCCHPDAPQSEAMFRHVQSDEDIEAAMRQMAKEQEEEWLRNNEKYLSKNPKIQLKDKKFVFTGASGSEHWELIQKKLKAKGGIMRTAVSGQTDYLVCEPSGAGDAKIQEVLQQRENGKRIEIILLSDLLPVLGITAGTKPKATPVTQKSMQTQKEKTASTPEPKRNATNSKYALSYSEGIRCGDDTYSIAIPDNFTLKKGAEGREFIAWLPTANAVEEYIGADIQFFAGQKTAVDESAYTSYPPELSGLVIENMYWSLAGAGFGTGKSRYIPLDSAQPAGGIIVNYEPGCFYYNASIMTPDYIKAMRVQVENAKTSDIPACDQMVVEWIKTMTVKKPFSALRTLDDSYFARNTLTDQLASEWEEVFNTRFSQVKSTFDLKIRNRGAKFQADSTGNDTAAKVSVDANQYLSEYANAIDQFLVMAVTGLERISEKSAGRPAMKKLLDVFKPFVSQFNTTLTLSIDGGKTSMTAPLHNIDSVRKRFNALERSKTGSGTQGTVTAPAKPNIDSKGKKALPRAEKKDIAKSAKKAEKKQAPVPKAAAEQSPEVLQRESALKAIQAEIKSEQNNYQSKRKELESRLRANSNKAEECQKERNSLGFFKFKEKKELAAELELNAKEKQAIENELAQLDTQHRQKTETLNQKRTLLSPKEGDSVRFGTDPNSGGKGALQWHIINVNGSKAELLCDHMIGLTSYYAAEGWLNKEFYPKAFSSSEQTVIIPNGKGKNVYLPQKAYDSGKASDYLREALIRKEREDGARCGHTQLQIQNGIGFRLEEISKYWIGNSEHDGWADLNTGMIGAAARFGVRPVITIDIQRYATQQGK